MKQPFNVIIPHHSVDSALDNTTVSPNLMPGFRVPGSIYSASSSSGVGSGYSSVSGGSRQMEHMADYHKRELLHTAENQLHSLMTSSPAIFGHSHSQHTQPPLIQPPPHLHVAHPFNSARDVTTNMAWMPHHDYQNMSFNNDLPRMTRNEESSTTTMTDSRSSRTYDIERASRLYQTDDVEPTKRFVSM